MRKTLLNIRKWVTLIELFSIIAVVFLMVFLLILDGEGYVYFYEFDFSSVGSVLGVITSVIRAYLGAVWIAILVSVLVLMGYYIYYLVRHAAAKTQSAAWIVLCIVVQIVSIPYMIGEVSVGDAWYFVGILIDVIALCLPKSE